MKPVPHVLLAGVPVQGTQRLLEQVGLVPVQFALVWQLPTMQRLVVVLQISPDDGAPQSESPEQCWQWLLTQASPALAPVQSASVAQFPATHAPAVEQICPVLHWLAEVHGRQTLPEQISPLAQSAAVPHAPCTHWLLALHT